LVEAKLRCAPPLYGWLTVRRLRHWPARAVPIRHRGLAWCADHAHIPEIAALAQPIDHWWPELLYTIHTGITNAATEDSTGSTSRRNAQPAGSATATTTAPAYASTPPGADDPRSQHGAGGSPLRLEAPANDSSSVRSAREVQASVVALPPVTTDSVDRSRRRRREQARHRHAPHVRWDCALSASSPIDI
jgi:hypothetical protein